MAYCTSAKQYSESQLGWFALGRNGWVYIEVADLANKSRVWGIFLPRHFHTWSQQSEKHESSNKHLHFSNACLIHYWTIFPTNSEHFGSQTWFQHVFSLMPHSLRLRLVLSKLIYWHWWFHKEHLTCIEPFKSHTHTHKWLFKELVSERSLGNQKRFFTGISIFVKVYDKRLIYSLTRLWCFFATGWTSVESALECCISQYLL